MESAEFLDIAVKCLPGGLILVDLTGRIRAINDTAETLLELGIPSTPGTPCEKTLAGHPKIVKVLQVTCQTLKGENRQELITHRTDGEKMVLGYGTLVLKDRQGNPVGVGLTFQDITRMIPLMDSHRFLDIALKNLPGGLIFVDLRGSVRGVNAMAQKILGLDEEVEPGTECHKAFVNHPKVFKVLMATCQSLQAANRQELITHRPNGDKLLLGYGTLILRNAQGSPVGVGLTFQDITRFIPLPLQMEFTRLIDRFFTPFAATMVVAAMWLGYAEAKEKYWALGIVTLLVGFNETSLYAARRNPLWALRIGHTRLVTNFSATIILVYLLGTFWGPMWLLFVLTPVATALYADWKKTIWTSVASAGALLGIYASRGLSGSVGWGQASLHAAFIVFISLFVNSIARLVMQIKSGGPAPIPAASRPIPLRPAPVEEEAAEEKKLAA